MANRKGAEVYGDDLSIGCRQFWTPYIHVNASRDLSEVKFQRGCGDGNGNVWSNSKPALVHYQNMAQMVQLQGQNTYARIRIGITMSS